MYMYMYMYSGVYDSLRQPNRAPRSVHGQRCRQIRTARIVKPCRVILGRAATRGASLSREQRSTPESQACFRAVPILCVKSICRCVCSSTSVKRPASRLCLVNLEPSRHR